jgi:MFS family permease
MGIGAGMAVPAVRRIVILADPEHLGTNLGRLLAADVAGFAMGPALSAILVGPFGIGLPFLVIAVATVACLPVIARVKVDESARAPRARLAFDLLRIRPFAGAVMMGAAVFLMIGTFDALWALVLSDLGSADWLSNLGITIFALPLVFLGPTGGRMAQRVGPFRLATVGLLAGATFMFLYGHMPSGIAMVAVGVFHSVNDGLTVSSTGVAVGLAAPSERQAGAQGLMGGVQTLVGGLTAVAAGAIYQHAGRAAAYTCCALAMVALVVGALALVGPTWRDRPIATVVERVRVAG